MSYCTESSTLGFQNYIHALDGQLHSSQLGLRQPGEGGAWSCQVYITLVTSFFLQRLDNAGNGRLCAQTNKAQGHKAWWMQGYNLQEVPCWLVIYLLQKAIHSSSCRTNQAPRTPHSARHAVLQVSYSFMNIKPVCRSYAHKCMSMNMDEFLHR